jgi:hypothetical protein
MLPRNQEKIRFETVLHLERGTRIHISQKRAEIFDFATHRTANRPHFVSNLIGSSVRVRVWISPAEELYGGRFISNV